MKSCLGSVIVLLIATGLTAAGIYVGTRWHGTFEAMLGGGSATTQPATTRPAGGARQLWTCSMHPQVISEEQGLCPICHMQLSPVGGAADHKEGESSNVVQIDPAVVQNMGLRVAPVVEGPLRKSLRLVGYLKEAQPNTRDVNLRVSGWIEHLHANIEGMHVKEGDPLFELYSPELQVAIGELLTAKHAQGSGTSVISTGGKSLSRTLFDSARGKLKLMGLDSAQIDELAKLDEAPDTVTFTSPITGNVLDKPVVEGAAVKMGERVLHIANLDSLWLEVQVFEKDLPFIALGQKVTVSIQSRPGESFEGEIIIIHPNLDMMTRAALVRLAIPNPMLALRLGMYAVARVDAQIAESAVLVPREAIIDSGDRQLSFVQTDVGKFEPRQLKVGLSMDDGMVQILEGLAPGELVITSGQFLIDTESRLREAIQKFRSGMDSSEGR